MQCQAFRHVTFTRRSFLCKDNANCCHSRIHTQHLHVAHTYHAAAKFSNKTLQCTSFSHFPQHGTSIEGQHNRVSAELQLEACHVERSQWQGCFNTRCCLGGIPDMMKTTDTRTMGPPARNTNVTTASRVLVTSSEDSCWLPSS